MTTTKIPTNEEKFLHMNILNEENITHYVKERFEEIKNDPNMGDLITFHSNNKYLIMAHNQEKLKTMGNIVANKKKNGSR